MTGHLRSRASILEEQLGLMYKDAKRCGKSRVEKWAWRSTSRQASPICVLPFPSFLDT